MDIREREDRLFKLHGFGDERLLRIEEVAVELGCSVYTINNWYKFKKARPDDKYAKLLPNYYQLEGPRQTRYWRKCDIPKLLDFKLTVPRGCDGVMGCITQKYYNKDKKRDEMENNES